MVSVFTEGYHVGYSREFVTLGTVYCTYGQSNTTTSNLLQSKWVSDVLISIIKCHTIVGGMNHKITILVTTKMITSECFLSSFLSFTVA